MDDPALDRKIHQQALSGLRRVNALSRTAAVLEKAIVNSGVFGGSESDLVIQLSRRLQKYNRPVQIEGCDISPTAIDFANQQAGNGACDQTRFFRHDVLKDELPAGSYHVTMCSLFLHHLDEPEALKLLAFMRQTASTVALVDDLKRTRPGYWLAWVGCRLLSRCRVVHVDGPRSVEGAFTVDEAVRLAVQAGWKEPRVKSHWPERFLMSTRTGS
jgi:2-polyprenyl-3-methyl-5-hydroxy-6-metoxy-1,4-benzoquinol methylase